MRLVKAGTIPVALGKALNKAEDSRLIADYTGDPIETSDAAWAVSQAKQFVQAILALTSPK